MTIKAMLNFKSLSLCLILIIFAGCDGATKISNHRYVSISGTRIDIISEKKQKLYSEEFNFRNEGGGLQLIPEQGYSLGYTINGNSIFLDNPFKSDSESNLIIISDDLKALKTSSSTFFLIGENRERNLANKINLEKIRISDRTSIEEYLRNRAENSVPENRYQIDTPRVKEIQIIINDASLNLVGYFASEDQEDGFFYSVSFKRIENIGGLYYSLGENELDFLSTNYEENLLHITLHRSDHEYVGQANLRVDLNDKTTSEAPKNYISYQDWIESYLAKMKLIPEGSNKAETDGTPRNTILYDEDPFAMNLIKANELVSNYRENYDNFSNLERQLIPRFGRNFRLRTIHTADADVISQLKLIHDYAWPDIRYGTDPDLDNALLLTTSYIKEFQNEMTDEVYSLFVATAHNILVEMGNYTAAIRLIDALPQEYMRKNQNLSLAAGQIKANMHFAEGEWEAYISQIFKIVNDVEKVEETYLRLAKAAISAPNGDLSKAKYWGLMGSVLRKLNVAPGDVTYINSLSEKNLYASLENISALADLMISQQEEQNPTVKKMLNDRDIAEQSPLTLAEQKELDRLARLKNIIETYDPNNLPKVVETTEALRFNLENFSVWDENAIEKVAPKYPSLYSRSGIYGNFIVEFDIKGDGKIELDSIKTVSFNLFQAGNRVSGPTRFFESEIRTALKKFKFKEAFFRGEPYVRRGIRYDFKFEL